MTRSLFKSIAKFTINKSIKTGALIKPEGSRK